MEFRNSSNTSVNQIVKRDRIFAYATESHSLTVRRRETDTVEEIAIEEGDQIEGSGHWDTDDSVVLFIEKINLRDDQGLDGELNTNKWKVFVLVPFDHGR